MAHNHVLPSEDKWQFIYVVVIRFVRIVYVVVLHFTTVHIVDSVRVKLCCYLVIAYAVIQAYFFSLLVRESN